MAIAFGVLLVGVVVVGFSMLAEKAAGATAPSAGTAPSTGSTGSGTLPTGAAGKLNASQQTFASTLASQTGLDPSVVAAWVLSEEPASASAAPNGANNWLNIGATDSGYYGAENPAWSDPAQAGAFTAQWLRGTVAPGFGAASSGIRNILSTAGQDASAQVSAIQHSGWASSGYPGLPALVAELAA
jgi:hypothetical protein